MALRTDHWLEHDLHVICTSLRRARTKGELLNRLYEEVRAYSLQDLMYLRGVIEREYRHLPQKYRKKLYPKTIEQVFGAHHCLICLYRNRTLEQEDMPVDKKFPEFCEMVEHSCMSLGDDEPRLTLLLYLLAAFTMFVLDLPGHPVGTPFPGGFEVEVRNGEYYCPIREKEDDVETSICPYCVAKQT